VDGVEFNSNNGPMSGGILAVLGNATITDCSFLNNTGGSGGAVYGLESAVEIVDSAFDNNSAVWGGALAVYVELEAGNFTVSNSVFNGNTASDSGGAIATAGQLAIEIQGAEFVGNTAGVDGGAIRVSDGYYENPLALEIVEARFINNEATTGIGGGLAIEPWMHVESHANIVNSEFVENFAGWRGGGLHGPATMLVSVTFANNLSDGTGDGLSAYEWPEMLLRDVVAWPDDLSEVSLVLDHSCVPLPSAPYLGIGEVILNADPFEPSDLELDGVTEFCLAPDSPCVDIGGVVDEYDWSVMTTQASQCTDAALVDAGVHYTPVFDAGPC
jgi:predicted outer membrane repeat protein